MKRSDNILELYQLIDRYLEKGINDKEFCYYFFEFYNIKVDANDLTDIEKEAFDALNMTIVDLMESDLKFQPIDQHYLKPKLEQKVKTTKELLMQQDVYENSDKLRLYWLINQYIIGNINESLFCDEFYYCYDLGIDRNKLNSVEKNAFQELDEIVSRFSPYKEDHLLDPKAFTTTEELNQKIIKTDLLLKTQNNCPDWYTKRQTID